MEEGITVALMAAAFWIGIALATRGRGDPDLKEEPDDESVWPSGVARLFGNKDRGGRPGGTE